MEAARHLQLLDPDTGEVAADAPSYADALHLLAEKEDVIAGLESEIRSLASKLTKARRDKLREAQDSDDWPKVREVFDYWRKVCNHPKSKFDLTRFEQIRPYLNKYGLELCKLAVDGAGFEPYITARKNGTAKRHDGIDLVFRSADKFEEFCNRAPRESK